MTDDQLHVDLATLARSRDGSAWSHAGEQLNATLLSWPPNHVVAEHVNDEREVLLFVVAGGGEARVDGVEHHIGAGSLIVLPRGAGRSIHAGPDGLAYVTTHLARGLLQVTRRRAPRVPPA